MSWKIRAALVGAAMLAVSGCAGTKEAARDVKSMTPGMAVNAEGTVQEVDAQGNLLAINSTASSAPSQPIWLHVVPGTTVEKDGQRISLEELKPGDVVRASFDRRGGPEEAIKIEVLSTAQ